MVLPVLLREDNCSAEIKQEWLACHDNLTVRLCVLVYALFNEIDK